MTEKEKRDAGELYDPSALLDELNRSKELCFDYNNLRPSDSEGMRRLLMRLLGRVGKNTFIQPPFWCDYGYNIETGRNFYANHGCVMLDCAAIKFGDNVFVGPGCGFYTAGHPLDAGLRRTGLEYAKPITVGDDVWFGGGVKVMPGVTIGGGTVICAGAVVTRDIPSGVMAGGVPARIIKEL